MTIEEKLRLYEKENEWARIIIKRLQDERDKLQAERNELRAEQCRQPGLPTPSLSAVNALVAWRR